ncbi:3'(2'),5'-bisphosphate nucleotidase [Anseongella ginsenosidimutans]|uniref:3'(2'),5'-bisphosphate nucleotidase CysQ n=1 Tax=Anseongella ginsenosidimutans TaxID=496056 RepID=A0A4V2UTM2_9SPHI|nr:3'(2'),5'-bisphosphate nucleotidase CysQ [Anseongella ginsenosidimutans]QEC52162.1 3'(2'),5'-bisphosphate nucleotidase CysQ [Anseongella ginsenosidimutans]TCS86702.1 3'(2'),5'-bisphosphate nucleotidase [Anseongella ginsenosidimutans]
MNNYLPLIINAALNAGSEILNVYRSEISVEWKADLSPLTEADRRAHSIIETALLTTGIPVLSEEGEAIAFSDRNDWERFWMVDPLDGTRQFISRSGDFTVNIALIEGGRPVLGVIYAPLRGTLYYGSEGTGSFKLEGIRPGMPLDWPVITGSARQLPFRNGRRSYSIVAGQYFSGPETEAFIELKRKQYGKVETTSVGSSLKICLVAEGSADVYPRLAPTMEWDTAAGHAIAKFAGCRVYDHATNAELSYNKENLRNPWFIVERPDFAAAVAS